jgi:hypothetical protein
MTPVFADAEPAYKKTLLDARFNGCHRVRAVGTFKNRKQTAGVIPLAGVIFLALPTITNR